MATLAGHAYFSVEGRLLGHEYESGLSYVPPVADTVQVRAIYSDGSNFSLGSVVRLSEPYLKSKEVDPAIVVLDENCKFAIPMLSDYLAGANALAGHLATVLGAIPVLTTASDSCETIGVDQPGRDLGWALEALHDTLVRASVAVVNGESVALLQEAGSTDWVEGYANGRSGPLPANIALDTCLEDIDPACFSAVLWISRRAMPAEYLARLEGRCVIYRPGAVEGEIA